MKSRLAVACVLAVALLLGASEICAGEGVLPPTGFEGWKLDGKPRTYSGQNLYNHINGGAEPFLELGFESCEVGRYTRGKQELTAECYRMSDSAAALGIYWMQCGKETPDTSFSERHTVGENQLTFVKGRHLIRLTGLPGACPRRGVFLAFARRCAERTPAVPEPAILSRLPSEGVVGGSLRIVRGPFTLQSLAPPFPPEALPFPEGTTGAAADLRGEGRELRTLLVVQYPDGAAASGAAASFRKAPPKAGAVPAAEILPEGPLLTLSWPVAAGGSPGVP